MGDSVEAGARLSPGYSSKTCSNSVSIMHADPNPLLAAAESTAEGHPACLQRTPSSSKGTHRFPDPKKPLETPDRWSAALGPYMYGTTGHTVKPINRQQCRTHHLSYVMMHPHAGVLQRFRAYPSVFFQQISSSSSSSSTASAAPETIPDKQTSDRRVCIPQTSLLRSTISTNEQPKNKVRPLSPSSILTEQILPVDRAPRSPRL